jgi:hypothetical protein
VGGRELANEWVSVEWSNPFVDRSTPTGHGPWPRKAVRPSLSSKYPYAPSRPSVRPSLCSKPSVRPSVPMLQAVRPSVRPYARRRPSVPMLDAVRPSLCSTPSVRPYARRMCIFRRSVLDHFTPAGRDLKEMS